MLALTKKQKLEKVMGSFELFAKNFIKIIDNNGDIVPFILNKEQSDYISTVKKYNVILKGRQIGFTTLSLAYMLYSAITKPDTSYMIMTHHNSVSKSLFVKVKKMYKNLPHDKYPELFPKDSLNNRDELFLSNGSRIIISTAGGDDAISGNTFQFIHFSEMGKYPNNVQEEILSTAIPALAKNDSAMIWIESTGMGYNYFAELFLKSYRGKESVWNAKFYSWLADAYRQQFKVVFDEAEEWFKLHNKGNRLREKDLEHDEQILFEKYGATLRQLMFRRYYIATNSIDKWNREFPTTPDQAFQTSNESVFSTDKIVERLQFVNEPLPYNELSDLPEVLKPYLGKSLYIWHLPVRGKRYYTGADTASGGGKNSDFSTISIFDADGQQVASFYNNEVPVYKFAEIVDSLARYYNFSFLVIESNSYGLPLIERIRKEKNYLNMYKHKTFDQKGKKRLKVGWQTTKTNKAILISDFKEQFEVGMINIECKQTLEQMKIFVDQDGKLGNKRGTGDCYHDDLVISAALAIQGMKAGKWYV